MKEFEFFTILNGQAKNIAVNLSEVACFGVVNRKSYNKDGSFKKWVKKGFIQINNIIYYWIHLNDVKRLRNLLSGKFTTSKNHVYEQKNGKERKAINWDYRLN